MTKSTRLILIASATVFLTGCQTTRPGNFCDVSAPIRPQSADIAVVSDQLARGVLAHNEYGNKVCGWTR